MKRLISLMLIFMFLLTACSPGLGDRPSGIGKEAYGRGTVSNLEPLNNGLWQIWIFGDSTYVYCTLDATLVEKVRNSMSEYDAVVFYTYRDWKVGDLEYDNTDSTGYRLSTTCGQLHKDTLGSKLLSLTLIKKPQ